MIRDLKDKGKGQEEVKVPDAGLVKGPTDSVNYKKEGRGDRRNEAFS